MIRVSDLRRRPRKTAVLASVVVSGVVSVVLIARTAVPYSVGLLSASAPRLLSLARFWLTPPYLFVTVHLIIVTIWKLSDQKSHRPEDDKPPAPPQILRKPSSEILRKPSSEILRKPSPEIPPWDPANSGPFTPPPLSEPPSPTAASPRLQIKKSENLISTSITIQRQEADDDDDDSLEARWKAIMAGGAAPVVTRSDTLERAPLPPPAAAAAAGLGSANEDLDQRFDEFIQKNYKQILVNGAN